MIALGVAVVAGFATLCFREGAGQSPSRGSEMQAADPLTAWTMAKEFVRRSLKAPSTADFGGPFGEYQNPDEHVSTLGGNRFECWGWVDAQNSFGAKLRSDWTCTVRMDGDKWVCEQVTID